MKILLALVFVTTSVYANDSLEQTYHGLIDTGEECVVRLQDSSGSASFTYHEDGKRKSCALTYDRYHFTDARDDGSPFATVSDKTSFKSCKLQVHFNQDGSISRLRMGLKSIFNPFHIYKDCQLNRF